MFINMLLRRIFISIIFTTIFLIAFHFVARNTFEMFLVFALFSIFLKLQLSHEFSEMRAQLYLLMNATPTENSDFIKLRDNMEEIFDANDLISQFSNSKKDIVSGDYNGRLFGGVISWVGQAWMVGVIIWNIQTII